MRGFENSRSYFPRLFHVLLIIFYGSDEISQIGNYSPLVKVIKTKVGHRLLRFHRY
jgi:hypothetical protein